MSPTSPARPCRILTCSALVDRGALCLKHRGKVTVVYGPPASGKSTYVADHKRRGDVVWDFDVMMTALTGAPRADRSEECIPLVLAMKDALVRALAAPSIERDAWIIVTHEDEGRRIAQALDADVLELAVAEEVRQQRLDARHRGR